MHSQRKAMWLGLGLICALTIVILNGVYFTAFTNATATTAATTTTNTTTTSNTATTFAHRLTSFIYSPENPLSRISNKLTRGNEQTDYTTGKQNYEVDPENPLNNLMNSFFPIDSVIRFNTTEPQDCDNFTSHQIYGRYASFSPILNHVKRTEYALLPHDACSEIKLNTNKRFKDFSESNKYYYLHKALVVLRGGCTFVDKVKSIMDSDLQPSAIIVANDEPLKGLLTMFSSTYNQDGTLEIPIMFITYEDYKLLQHYEGLNLTISISTATVGSWVTIMLSMIFSPPLLIIVLYAAIVCGQKLRRRQINKRNAEMVKELPVYIYNDLHLIKEADFKKYLKEHASEFDNIEASIEDDCHGNSNSSNGGGGAGFDGDNDNDYGTGVATPKSEASSLIRKKYEIRIDPNLAVLSTPAEFFRSYKCSICLEKYRPLKSRVLILKCRHFFHEKCLSNWLINFKRSCPLCNSAFLDPDLNQQVNQRGVMNDGVGGNYGATADLELAPENGSLVESVASTTLRVGPTVTVFEINNPPILSNEAPQTLSRQTSFNSRPILMTRPLAILSQYNNSSGLDREELSTSIDSAN